MSRTIWKFPLALTDEQVIRVPHGAEPLTVQTQGTQVCLWAVVEPSAPLGDVTIYIVGTGHPLPAEGVTYIGTSQLGPFVWHVFTRDADY